MDKFICSTHRCDWHGFEDELLTAQNPFENGEILSACPKCKEVESAVIACDEPECWERAICGTPTENGYRWTCGKHRPTT